jgi:hypothetical protein
MVQKKYSKTKKLYRKKGGNLEEDEVKKNMRNIVKAPNFNERLLKMVCTNSGVCLDFGKYNDLVKQYFDNFMNFNITRPAKRIGKPSENGAILNISYVKNDYQSYAILKISCAKSADNLMYEAYVGKKFINKYIDIYPCFTETYGLFSIPDILLYENLINDMNNNKSVVVKSLNLIHLENFEIDKICINPTQYCVLIQYFDSYNSIYDEIKNGFLFTSKEMPCILYQIYFCLERLKDEFTHYDLHSENGGFYKPFPDKYIIINYHLENGKIMSFPTIYISKIIDYGRCHIKETKQIMDDVCQNKICHPDCGDNYGFNVIRGIPREKADDPKSEFYWINPLITNKSHDLRLIANFKSRFKNKFNFFNDIVYLDKFGTPQNLTPYNKTDKIIRNVSDMRESLEDFLPEWCKNELTEKYYMDKGITKAGDIHVYTDGRPYEYIVSN